jgi:uncharacterized LabA/DUF88 family protein
MHLDNQVEKQSEKQPEVKKKYKNNSRNKNDLENLLISNLGSDRICVLVDAANFFHSALKANIRIDFLQVASWFKLNTNNSLSLRFYTAYNPLDSKQIEFLSKLQEVGYQIIKKPIKTLDNIVKGNMDIELAVDAVRLIPEYDTMVLMSGDGDFTYLVNHLEQNYKKTILLGIGGYTSFELHKVADSYFFLNRISKVWKSQASLKSIVDENYFILSTEDYTSTSGNQSDDSTEVTLPEKLTKTDLIADHTSHIKLMIEDDYK